MSQEPKIQLTIEDPIDEQTLTQLSELYEARLQLGERLLDLEQERIQILASAKKVDDQRHRLFQMCLVDRGLPPTTRCEIDAKNGHLKIVSPEKTSKKRSPD